MRKGRGGKGAGAASVRELILTHWGESCNPVENFGSPPCYPSLSPPSVWEQTMRNYDVVILGGAFSGAAAAILLRRDRPDLSVLVVDRQREFDAKVGEATTEMSGMLLTRRLAMWQHI